MALLTNSGKVIRRAPEAIPRPELVKPLAKTEREAIESAMILCEGNRTLAAKRLDIAYRTLLRKIEDFRRTDGEIA